MLHVLGHGHALSGGRSLTPSPPERSAESFSSGPLSSGNRWVAAVAEDATYDFLADRTLVYLFESTAIDADLKAHIGIASAATGWNLYEASATLTFLFRNGTGFGVPLSPGYHCLAVTRTAAGALRYSYDGAAAVLASASPTYVPIGAGAKAEIGSLIELYPNAQLKFLESAFVGAELDDAALVAASECVHAVNRYQLTDAVRGHASMISLTVAADAGAALVSRAGSAPITYAKVGSPTLNTIEAENLWPEQQSWWDAIAYYEARIIGGKTVHRRNPFARMRFTTNATRIAVDGASDNTLSNKNLGAYDGTTRSSLALARASGATKDLYMVAGTKVVDLWDGPMTAASSVSGVYVRNVRVPSSATFSVAAGTAGTDHRLVGYGDSIANGYYGTLPETQGWFPLLGRGGDWTGQAALEGWAARSLHDDAGTAELRAAFVLKLAAMLNGSSSNTLVMTIGTNDWGMALWPAEEFGAVYAAVLDDVRTAVPSVVAYLVTPLTRGGEATPNGLGDVLQDLRDEIDTIASARSGWCTAVAGPSMVTYPTNFPDLLHPNTAGHAEFKAALKTAMGY